MSPYINLIPVVISLILAVVPSSICLLNSRKRRFGVVMAHMMNSSNVLHTFTPQLEHYDTVTVSHWTCSRNLVETTGLGWKISLPLGGGSQTVSMDKMRSQHPILLV
jgi:hypothetical protein